MSVSTLTAGLHAGLAEQTLEMCFVYISTVCSVFLNKNRLLAISAVVYECQWQTCRKLEILIFLHKESQ